MKLRTKITGAIIILCCFIYATFNDLLPDNEHKTWTHYGGSPDQSKYFNAIADHQRKCEPDAGGLGLSYHGFCF